jgi:hypothetical protein
LTRLSGVPNVIDDEAPAGELRPLARGRRVTEAIRSGAS